MKQKRIAFFVQHMLCGGVENALIALTGQLSVEGHQVIIYVIRDYGDFMNKMPDGVQIKVVPMNEAVRKLIPVGGSKLAMRECKENHEYVRALNLLVNRALDKTGFAELAFPKHKVPELDTEFDIAVNFHMHSPFLVWYLSEKVKAKRKLSWIHNDFTTTQYHIEKLKQYLECCEAFYGVSKCLVNEFAEIFPEWKDRVSVMYNIVPIDQILKKGEEDCPEFSKVPVGMKKILSVGRLENQKGYDLTIDVCTALKQKGYKFKWLVLGEGSERAALEKLVADRDIGDVIEFIGIRMNPYPYFKNCDIYVQTSRHEGYVTTVTEANIFERPIVCTDVSGAKEQITDDENGYVVPFLSEEIVKKIEYMMCDKYIWKSNGAIQSLKTNIKNSVEIFY